MNEPGDLRSDVYAQYLASGGLQSSYSPQALSDAVGDELYGKHLDDVDQAGTVIELGAGAGHFLAYLRRKGFSTVRGVDLVPPLVNMAREQGLDVVHGDVLGFLAGLADASCSAVVAIDLVEHLSREELLKTIRACLRVLKPGGTLLLQTVNGQGLFPGQVMFGDLTHITILNPASMSQLLAMSGFTDVRFYETGPLGTSMKDRARKLAWHVLKSLLNLCRWIETRKRQDVWTENMICCCRKPAGRP
jgi:SAM-dependent methyltransferase